MGRWATTLAGLKLLLLTVSVAGSDFICPAEGLFRKSGSCNEYYHCTNVNGYLYVRAHECPGSSLFDDTQRDCVQASYLTSPRGCMKHPLVNEQSLLREVSIEDSGEQGYDATESLTGYPAGGSAVSDSNESLERNTFEDYDVKGTAESHIVDSPARAITEIKSTGKSPTVDSPARAITEVKSTGESPTVDSLARAITEVKGTKESPTVDSITRAITEQLEGPVIEDDGTLGSNETINSHSMDARNISNETLGTVISDQQNAVSNVSSNATKDIQSLCDQMNRAEAYFELVASSPLLHESLDYKRQYNRIVQQYNRDIKKAHNNTYLWRRGSSIPLGLKRNHKKAIEYEQNFKRTFDIFKKQIGDKVSQKVNPDVIQILERQIQDLKASIRRELEILDTTKIPSLPDYLGESINFTLGEIERLESEKNRNPEEILLRELANFLRYVKNDTRQVESKVTQVLDKMVTLLENIRIDAQDYDKLSNEISIGFRNLHEEAEQIQKELKRDAKYQDKPGYGWKGLGGILYDLRNKESQAIKEIREREENLDHFLEKKRMHCYNFDFLQNFINTNATEEEMLLACIHILEANHIPILDLDAENARLTELHQQMKMIQSNQSEAMKELGSVNTQRTRSSYTSPENQRLEEIEFELYNIQSLDDPLKNLQHGVAAARESILILHREFQKLQEKFNTIVTKLQEMIDAANAAVDDGAQVGQRILIENELEELQTTLQNLVLNNINECPKPYHVSSREKHILI